jgi:hypothetical protein
MTTGESHKGDQDDDATAKKSWWRRRQPQENWQVKWQRKEHEASLTLKALEHHGCEGQLQPGPVCDDPEQHKNQRQE